MARHASDTAFLKSREWRDHIRPVALARDPVCRHCVLTGRVTPTKHIDHITPPYGDRTLQRDLENMMGLWLPCHSRKGQYQDTDKPYFIGRDSEWRMVFSDGSKRGTG